MASPIDFYFDFSSPYGYLASQKIDALGQRYGRAVDWHPFLLGVVFKTTGTQPLTEIPLKGEYSKRDFQRSARYHGLEEFQIPERFPIPTQNPARIVVWLKGHEPARAVPVAKTLYHAYFRDHVDISDADNAAAVVAKAGVDSKAARAAIDDPAIKDAFRREVEQGMRRGVFGSPFVIVDGEPFWGLDRLDQVERWLRDGKF